MSATASSNVFPNLAMIARYVEVVFGYAEGHVPVRLIAEKGMPPGPTETPFHPADGDLAAVIHEHARRADATGRALYVVPGCVARPGRAKAEDIVETGVVLVDLDEGDIAAKRAHLLHHLGTPALEIASGGLASDGQPRLHLYWRLTEPARGSDLGAVAALRARVAEKVGGDRSFASLHQPIRIAGSIHGKHGHRRVVEIIASSGREIDLDDLAEAVAAMPVLPGAGMDTSDRAPGTRAGPGADDLQGRQIREGAVDEVTRFEAISMVIGHWLRRVRLGKETLAEAWKAIREYNAACIRPPWPEDRLRREFDALKRLDDRNHGQSGPSAPSQGSAGPGEVDRKNPRQGEGGADDGSGTSGEETGAAADGPGTPAPPFSEDALAAAFTAAHGDDWRHVLVWGRWLHWSGQRWEQDARGEVREHLRQICRVAAARAEKPGEARRIASERTIRAAEAIARTDPRHAEAADAWDLDPMLLNTPSGILDVASGEIGPHRRQARITKLAGASPGDGCPLWERFVAEITGGDTELAAYLARVCGYCLTGQTSEQAFFFLHGPGANGKSVLLSIIADVLGDYAATAPLETFMASRGDRHPTELAGLMGTRAVLVSETEPGRSWAESRIKTVTGGDRIRARFMHRDFFEFTPGFKLLVAGNHRPRLDGVGEAMRRRLHLIPFTVTIPPDRRDPDLIGKLRSERDGILGWMLAGCADWQRRGLAPPETVVAAGAAYAEDEDLVGQWIAEACIVGRDAVATSAALFESWSSWADATGSPRGSQRDLGEALKARGFKPARRSGARCWTGIATRRGVFGNGAAT